MDEKLKKKYDEILARYTGAYILDQNLGVDLSDMVRAAREFEKKSVDGELQISNLIAQLADTQVGEAYWKHRWATEVDDLVKRLDNLKCDKCGDTICQACAGLGSIVHICAGCDSEISEE
jgi:hypothetical protein